MKKILLFLAGGAFIISCNQKNKEQAPTNTGKKNENTAYIITKDGIGEIKIGMTQAELEKTLQQKLKLVHANDSGESWLDTATARYRDIDLSLYFERQYSEKDLYIMQLIGVATTSPLCKTVTGLGIGSEKKAILDTYDDDPITMGPAYEMVNDTTSLPSKSKFDIYVNDEGWDKHLVFRLVSKKVVAS